MKSVLIVVAFLVSTVYVECSPNKDLLDRLDDLLFEATLKKNQAAIDAITEAIDTVGLAMYEMLESDDAKKAVIQQHIDVVAADLPKLEAMVNQEIKTRAFNLSKGFDFVTSKASLLTEKVKTLFSAVSDSQLGSLIALVKPFLDKALNDPNVKAVAGNLGTVTSALESIDKMTGGMFEPLKVVKDLFANIDSTGQLFKNLGEIKSPDELADALINTLTAAKSSHLNKVEKALDYVCNGLDDVQKAAAAKQA